MRYRPVLLVLVLCWISPNTMSAQVTLEVSTDKTEYAYGEPIVITVRMENNTSNPFSISGSSSCQADFRFDDYDNSQRPCTADLIEIRFNPGAWRAWTWVLDPAEMGLPSSDGTHTIVGFFGSFEDSTSVSAPAYLGGLLDVSFPVGTAESAISTVRDSLNAEVLGSSESDTMTYELWQIGGMTLDAAIVLWGADPRFSSFEPRRYTSQYFITSRDRPADLPTDHPLMTVYPNPCVSTCHVMAALGDSGTPAVTVRDVLGRQVFLPHSMSGSGPAGEHLWHLDATGLSPGVYLISVQSGAEVLTSPVAISH